MSVLEDGRGFRVLEALPTFCTLGVRFWDAATDAQVRGGLQVRLWPEASLWPIVAAERTYSDLYAFHRVPGLGAVERPATGADDTLGSPGARPFVLEVRDLKRRFLGSAISLSLPLPQRGPLLTSFAGSPAPDAPGYYLFSASTRGQAPNIAVVRGELVDDDTGVGAAHALVVVEIPGEPPVYAVADAGGAFAAHFPYPTLPGGFRPLDASPPGPPIGERAWQLRVSVLYQPDLLDPLPGSAYPDVRAVFSQAPAGVLLDIDSSALPAAHWAGTLEFGGETVVRGPEASSLRVIPAV